MTTLTWDPAIGRHHADVDRRRKEHAAAWSYSWVCRRRREAFWAEHGRWCDRCGWHRGAFTFRKRYRNRQLEVHHLNYEYPAGEEPDRALRALCDRCHDSKWEKSVHQLHRRRYIWGRPYRRQDHWPYDSGRLERVTDRAILFGWWRRLLRSKP